MLSRFVSATIALVLFYASPAFAGARHGGSRENVTAAIEMSLDDPKPGQVLAWPLLIRGWALDRNATAGVGVDIIHVYAYPNPGSGLAPLFLGDTTVGGYRPDVAAVFGPRFEHSGFFFFAYTPLAPGPYQIVAYGRSTASGAFEAVRSAVMTVAPGSRPAGSIDSPSSVVGPRFVVSGWVLDGGATDGTGLGPIHVYAVPTGGGPAIFLGAPWEQVERPDVGVIYGWRFLYSGYRLPVSGVPPGEYTLVVYAFDHVSNSWIWHTRPLSVRAAGAPMMNIDGPAAGATLTQPFDVSGWAIDYDATPPSRGTDIVHVWAIPLSGAPATFIGVSTLGEGRDDVGNVFGAQFTLSGFHVTVDGLPAGSYLLAAYAHSTITNAFESRAVAVTIK